MRLRNGNPRDAARRQRGSGGASLGGRATKSTANALAAASVRLPDNWRDRLPDPATYYAATLGKLTRTIGSGYAQARCPFHEDGSASLSVNIAGRGGWNCLAGCGSGDLLSFHQRLRRMNFKDSVLDLLRSRA